MLVVNISCRLCTILMYFVCYNINFLNLKLKYVFFIFKLLKEEIDRKTNAMIWVPEKNIIKSNGKIREMDDTEGTFKLFS